MVSEVIAETVKYYQKVSSRLKYITVLINNVPVEMVFDTGASHIVLNSEGVRKIGISRFGKRLKAESANGSVESFSFIADSVKLGSIELKNVEIHYVPKSAMNLLGGTFLSNFDYFVSERSGAITFFPVNDTQLQAKDQYLFFHINEKGKQN
ncbi:MAG: retroviral-like aspartic protease family protein [Nitrospirae bacterium]|nr:retroviral-like aspartic protease family protein [Nitrospirota bacterium]